MLPFYERSEVERIALTTAAKHNRDTIVSRWSALRDGEAEGWASRAQVAAGWLEDCRGVLDLGCGTMLLERFLDPSLAYHPSDLIARDERTIVCDLNRAVPPKVDADAVTCLGLIEYLHDPRRLLVSLNDYGFAVVSYNVLSVSSSIDYRRSHGWMNDYSIEGLECLFEETGWAILQRQYLNGDQYLWNLRLKPSNESKTGNDLDLSG